MKTFITEFHERQEDVREYLKLLIFFDSLATNKRKTIEGESYNGKIISFLPNRECQKILRATLTFSSSRFTLLLQPIAPTIF